MIGLILPASSRGQTFSFSPDHAWSEKREPGRGTLGNLRLVFMAHVRPSALKMSVWQGVKNAKQGIKQTIRAGRGGFSFRAKSPPKGAGRQVQVQPKAEEKRPDDKLDERHDKRGKVMSIGLILH